MGFFDFLKKNKVSPKEEDSEEECVYYDIDRLLEIVDDCVRLVNTSNNFKTVVGRYNDLISTLHKIIEGADEDTLIFDQTPSEVLAHVTNEKATILNEAVKRAYDDMLVKSNSLKTEKGCIDRKVKFFQSLKEGFDEFPSETQIFICSLAEEDVSQVSEPPDHTEGDFILEVTGGAYGGSEEIRKFYELSQKIEETKDIREKIKYCEESFPLLPTFMAHSMADECVPPIILCRDTFTWSCYKLGEWDKLDKAIDYFESVDLFSYMVADPKGKCGQRLVIADGTKARKEAMSHKAGFTAALKYIKETPGVLQSKIYKVPELSHVPPDILKSFCRNSLQIRKEKEGKTNKLYVME